MQKNGSSSVTGPIASQWVIITKTVSKILLILLAFVPWLVDDNVIFPFISPKMLAIRVVMTLVTLIIALNLIVAKSYRQEFYSKVKRMLKNPVFLTTAGFIITIGLSVIFATDKYHAFWGNIERAEGFAGIAFYFAFFPLAYLLFTRRDWLWFFRATLLMGLVLFVNEIATIPPGNSGARPGSFTGNPSFLAGFFLFVIMAAIIVAYGSRHEAKPLRLSWQIASAIMVVLSVIGIFETQTRGTILGLIAGILLLGIYFIAKGRHVKVYKQFTLRNISIAIVALVVIFSALFIVTKNAPFWQNVPGLSRFASISLTTASGGDSSIQTRIISTEIGLKAMNPADNGLIKFIFGWGQENFDIAYNKYYIPRYYEFEQAWFDRAHDKIIDVLVMNGVLGLIVYAAMWLSFLWTGFRKQDLSVEKIALLFFGAAFFVNLLSLFDQISTYIPLFAALAYMAWIRDEEHQNNMSNVPENFWPYLMYAVLAVILAFFVYVLTFSLIAYGQMRSYVGLLETGTLSDIEQGIGGVLTPYSYAQEDIRGDLVQEITNQMQSYPQDAADLQPLMNEALSAEEQVVQMDPWDPRQSLIIASAYDAEGTAAEEEDPTSTASLDYFKDAEVYYNWALQLAPERQDVLMPAAQNLFYQGNVSGALALLKQAYQEDPKVAIADYEYGYVLAFGGTQNFAQAIPLLDYAVRYYQTDQADTPWDTSQLISVYQGIASYFAQQKDTANFIETMDGLVLLDPGHASAINAAVQSAQAGEWYKINISTL